MLTPEDIFEKEFKRSVRGYNADEVNEFLDQVIQDYARLIEENKSLRSENQQLKSATGRQNFHEATQNTIQQTASSLASEKITLQDIVRRVEALERKIKYL